ncbi:hypothetical protein [Trinickia fusca]|uniref:hypothetical protein n=1 Tax=Trinickia fusca TaxID=2419777 RepID=UPI0011C3D86E|nr:hypothetical protein [Trinickia fusca]
MDTDLGKITAKFKFTRDEARSWIKAAKPTVRFYVHVRINQAVEGVDDKRVRNAARTSVELTQSSALDLVRGCLSTYSEETGRRIPCSVFEHGEYMAYWIGG